jgi:hypothetical protein
MCKEASPIQLEPQPGGVIPSSAQLINQLLGEPPETPPTLFTIVQPFHVLARQPLAQPLLKLSDQMVACEKLKLDVIKTATNR